MGNGWGDIHIDRDTDMAAHDACPASLRHVANHAVLKYSSLHLLHYIRASMAAHNFGYERAFHAFVRSQRGQATDSTRAAYGLSHPEAGS